MAGYDPNAQTYFDGLYNYYRAHPSENNHDLMAWKQLTGCVNSSDSNSASDGDLDMAYGLLLADRQWGSAGPVNYFQAALRIIDAIRQDEIHPVTLAVKLGDWAIPGDPMYDDTRTSDFLVNHFRAFEIATGDSSWRSVLDRCYSLVGAMQTNFSPATGLIPDFIRHVSSSPAPAGPHYLESAYDGHYYYNACRDPFRLAVDYLISGEPRAYNAVKKMNAFIRAKTGDDPEEIRAGYRLNGSTIDTFDISMAFIAPFAVGAMIDAVNQPWLNKLWTTVDTTNFDSNDYYGNTLKMLAMIVLSGNWWNPQPVPAAPMLIAPPNFSIVQSSPAIFRWRSSPGTASYTVECAADSIFSAPVLNDSAVTDTNRQFSGMTNNTSYYWRVSAGNAGGSSAWSQVWKFTYSNPAKWKLLSIPLKVADPRKQVLFPSAISNAFAYDSSGGYTIQDSLSNGIGYWLKFGADQTSNIHGDSISADTIDVQNGWNLIGSVSSAVPVASISSLPPNISTSNFFAYDGGYAVSGTIVPGWGYWVKASQSGKLILSSSSMASAASTIVIIPTSEQPPPPPERVSTRPGTKPEQFSLEQNYPNPFNPSSTISFAIPKQAQVRLEIFNVLGRLIATLLNEEKAPGRYSVIWEAGRVTSGVYFYRIRAGDYVQTRKAILLK
jgi:endo-1,4-beta-D-glucanase Y